MASIGSRASYVHAMTPSVIIVSGPSGVGKGTVIARALELSPIRQAVSATTRPPRAGERDGHDYIFLSPAEFDLLMAAGRFLEHAEFAGHRYGTLRSTVTEPLGRGESVLLECDVRGAAAIQGALGALTVFIAPPSLEVLADRLRGRGSESESACRMRLRAAAQEIGAAAAYDLVIVNDDPERAARELAEVFFAASIASVAG